MNEIDIIQQIKSGEVSKMQFKERLLDSYDIDVVEHWSLV